MRRCVVNVSTGVDYRALQGRLSQQLDYFGHCEKRLWIEPLPKSWPKHENIPYAFKAHALKEASFNVDLIAWMDSAILPLRSLEPFWDRIEREDYFIPANPPDMNYTWTAESAYDDLFPDMPTEEAKALNKIIPHCSSSVFGMNLLSEIGRTIFFEFCRLADTRAFIGPWANSDGPDKDRYTVDYLKALYLTAPCGPPDVRGHRHDQTALSVIAWNLGLELDTEMYAHPEGHPEPGEKVILYHKI
jgi:hypothetical protein